MLYSRAPPSLRGGKKNDGAELLSWSFRVRSLDQIAGPVIIGAFLFFAVLANFIFRGACAFLIRLKTINDDLPLMDWFFFPLFSPDCTFCDFSPRTVSPFPFFPARFWLIAS